MLFIYSCCCCCLLKRKKKRKEKQLVVWWKSKEKKEEKNYSLKGIIMINKCSVVCIYINTTYHFEFVFMFITELE